MTALLKIMVLNAQDLFLFMDKHTGSIEELNEIKWQLMSASLFLNKSKEKCLLLGKTILASRPDIIMITEVGGVESLGNFAEHVLNGEYEALSLPSNSDRGIDLGYLVKRNLPYTYDLRSHVDYPLPPPARRFSRDVLRMDVLQEGELKFILLVVHIKSKLDMKKSDFEGRGRRVHEIKALVEIYLELTKLGVPIFVGGDFNGHAAEKDTEEEFRPIYEQTDLKDVAYLAGIPEEERFSYIYFNRGGARFKQQIDYLFLSEQFSSLVVPSECYFPRYLNLEGSPLPLPMRLEQKGMLPSDHYPFIGTFDLSLLP